MPFLSDITGRASCATASFNLVSSSHPHAEPHRACIRIARGQQHTSVQGERSGTIGGHVGARRLAESSTGWPNEQDNSLQMGTTDRPQVVGGAAMADS